MMKSLTPAELDELGTFLISDVASEETLTLAGLDGYLTAIAAGPVTLLPSQWLGGIWGPTDDDAPNFETMEQAQRVLGLLMRHYNGIIGSLERNPDAFRPVFDTVVYADDAREYRDAEAWAFGFMQAIALSREYWQPLFDDPQGQAWMRPLRLLGGDEAAADEVAPDDAQLMLDPSGRETLADRIPAAVAGIYRYWLPYRRAVHERRVAATAQRSEPKIGRNDPCPCGSGKKFKKCCGAAATLH
ncbi:UPF0149 family protein [Burkholderia vietnamiensis]|uniref:UPF0149 family protein n=1 Tax=Burkholderia vietnamiensis TaxID=60552 RepID=UPI001B9A0DBD|nr:UPF0149 family protein [Burkholderia vietnamiensis]MBR8036479.1 UPF0149 family protein [Burkholderia vietnamiensis]